MAERDMGWALNVHKKLCSLFDHYCAADTKEDAERLRDEIAHEFINGGEEAMHVFIREAGYV